jgi:hypothetical protein
MATVLEEYTTDEQRSVVRFLWAKELNAKKKKIFLKKCFTFMVGSVFRVERFTSGSRNMANVTLMTKKLKRRCGSV